MGGKMKLLSGKTALRWLSATRAATKTGGQASDLCGNPTTSWGCPFMLQKGFFLALINFNAVINLFLYSLLQRKRVSRVSGFRQGMDSLGSGKGTKMCSLPTAHYADQSLPLNYSFHVQQNRQSCQPGHGIQ